MATSIEFSHRVDWNEKINKLKQEVEQLNETERELKESPDGQVSHTDPEARSIGLRQS